jgi:hypothetical protein
VCGHAIVVEGNTCICKPSVRHATTYPSFDTHLQNKCVDMQLQSRVILAIASLVSDMQLPTPSFDAYLQNKRSVAVGCVDMQLQSRAILAVASLVSDMQMPPPSLAALRQKHKASCIWEGDMQLQTGATLAVARPNVGHATAPLSHG